MVAEVLRLLQCVAAALLQCELVLLLCGGAVVFRRGSVDLASSAMPQCSADCACVVQG